MTDISPERIERAAAAIWVKSGNKEPWPTEPSIGKNMYRLAAKAALEADASAIEGARAEERDTELLVAGWNACRKSVYAVCESVINENEKHRDDQENAIRHHFGRGGMSAAKSIARGFNSMEALDDDNLSILIRSRTPVTAEADKGLSKAINLRPEDMAVVEGLAAAFGTSETEVILRALQGLLAYQKSAKLADELDARAAWLSPRHRVADAILMQRAAAVIRAAAPPSISSEGV